MNLLARLAAPIAMPWNAFVAAFLYYTLLAVVLVGGANPGNGAVAGAYAMPPIMYGATLIVRLYRAAEAWLKPARDAGLSPTAHSAA
jgi:hypothetical protein